MTKPSRVSIAINLYRTALRLMIEDSGLVNKINRIMMLMILMGCQFCESQDFPDSARFASFHRSGSVYLSWGRFIDTTTTLDRKSVV